MVFAVPPARTISLVPSLVVIIVVSVILYPVPFTVAILFDDSGCAFFQWLAVRFYSGFGDVVGCAGCIPDLICALL